MHPHCRFRLNGTLTLWSRKHDFFFTDAPLEFWKRFELATPQGDISAVNGSGYVTTSNRYQVWQLKNLSQGKSVPVGLNREIPRTDLRRINLDLHIFQ